jgi:hypothetical protein
MACGKAIIASLDEKGTKLLMKLNGAFAQIQMMLQN